MKALLKFVGILSGVPQNHPLDVLFSAGFDESDAASKCLTKWVC